MHRVSKLALAVALAGALAFAGAAYAQEPQFSLGFQAFADMLPDIVGQPLEDASYDAIGNATQPTTTGLLVWNKLDNTVAFTNGTQTWVLAPEGLLLRNNDERFQFEVLREGVENQLDAQIDPLIGLLPPDELQAEIDLLTTQAQSQLEFLDAQLEQPDAIVIVPVE